MRIVSLVPSATELLFALGLGDEVIAVTHECDYPLEALERPRVTRDVLEPGLSARQIDAAVRERTSRGEAIYALDEEHMSELEPDLIVTQAVCAVCAVSYDDVVTIAERMDSLDFGWAVMAISIQREVGGNLSELLMTVAETMTQRERLRRDVKSLTAEGPDKSAFRLPRWQTETHRARAHAYGCSWGCARPPRARGPRAAVACTCRSGRDSPSSIHTNR